MIGVLAESSCPTQTSIVAKLIDRNITQNSIKTINLEDCTAEHFSKIPYSLRDKKSSPMPIYIKCPDLYLIVKFGFAYFYATITV